MFIGYSTVAVGFKHHFIAITSAPPRYTVLTDLIPPLWKISSFLMICSHFPLFYVIFFP